MTSFEIWALALGLAMDCFAVSITGGIILKQNKWGVIIKNAFMFGLFQAIMPVIGWACASWFSHQIKEYDHWIAFALLAFLGGKMIIESIRPNDCENESFNPASNKTILVMAVATSIDALAVGISFAFLYNDGFHDIIYPVSIIGLVSFIMSVLGFVGGTHFCRIKKLKPEIVGGIILIGIGLKILIEHFSKGI